MIRISFKPGSDARVIAAIKARGPKIVESLRVALDQSMLMLQRRIQEKLSGEVLQDRGGLLKRSVEKQPTELRGSQIVGSVTSSGGPAFYGFFQERGTKGPYEILPKNKLALAFFPSGSLGAGGGIAQVKLSIIRNLFTKSGKAKGSLKAGGLEKFGQFGGVVVKKVTHPGLIARPFMSSSLKELQDEIVARIKQAAVKAVTE